MIELPDAIAKAQTMLGKIHPNPEFLDSERKESLDEFPGSPGWSLMFRVFDPDFGTFERPVEVNELTGEASIVRILL